MMTEFTTVLALITLAILRLGVPILVLGLLTLGLKRVAPMPS